MNLRMLHYDPKRDFGEIFRLFVNVDINSAIMNRPDRSNAYSFEKWLNEALTGQINDFFVVWDRKKFVGLAYSYDFTALDGHTAITIALDGGFQNTGIGAVVAARFVRYLFDSYSLRKVYMRVYAYNKRSIAAIKRFGLSEEAVLKQHRFYKGCYHDLIIFSITRDEFSNELSDKLTNINKGALKHEEN